MYYEAKVLFVLYLWHPKTQGAVYLYNRMLQPFLAKNEGAIDQCIEELKTTCFDYAASYFQKCILPHVMLIKVTDDIYPPPSWIVQSLVTHTAFVCVDADSGVQLLQACPFCAIQCPCHCVPAAATSGKGEPLASTCKTAPCPLSAPAGEHSEPRSRAFFCRSVVSISL